MFLKGPNILGLEMRYLSRQLSVDLSEVATNRKVNWKSALAYGWLSVEATKADYSTSQYVDRMLKQSFH